MTVSDWIMILAIFLGPIVAIQLAEYLNAKKGKRQRKLDIFKTLMATRAYTVSWDHVMTLNRIDLEFEKSNNKEKDVIETWKAYLDHLSSEFISVEQWETKRVALLVELLHKMAIVLDYDFDKTHIKNSSYSPRAHGTIQNQEENIRAGLIEILEGRRPVPMRITNWPEETDNDRQTKA